MPKKPKKKWFKGPLTGQGHGAYMIANGRTNGQVHKKKKNRELTMADQRPAAAVFA